MIWLTPLSPVNGWRIKDSCWAIITGASTDTIYNIRAHFKSLHVDTVTKQSGDVGGEYTSFSGSTIHTSKRAKGYIDIIHGDVRITGEKRHKRDEKKKLAFHFHRQKVHPNCRAARFRHASTSKVGQTFGDLSQKVGVGGDAGGVRRPSDTLCRLPLYSSPAPALPPPNPPLVFLNEVKLDPCGNRGRKKWLVHS